MAIGCQKMVPWFVLILLYLQGALCDLIVTHTPSYVPFLENDGDLRLSEVQDVVSTALGYEINKDLTWQGLGQGSLFQRPKANVIFSLEGLPHEDLDLKHVARYSTDMDVAEVSTDGVVNNIQNAATNEKPLIVDFSVETTVFGARARQPDLLKNVPVTHQQLHELFSQGRVEFSASDHGSLNYSRESDLVFLGELHLIQEVVNNLKGSPKLMEGKLPNFFHFKVRGLRNLVEDYGKQSAEVADAWRLLQQFLDQMTEAFRDIYHDNVIIEVVTLMNDDQLSRKGRSLLQSGSETQGPPVAPTQGPPVAPTQGPAGTPTQEPSPTVVPTNLKLATPYDALFPVAFNIILWLCILLGLAIFGVSYGMWNMDPGRDSIIYRMTSQRIKKD